MKDAIRGVCIHGDCLADALRGTDFCSAHTVQTVEGLNGQQMYEKFVLLQMQFWSCQIPTWEELEESDRDCWNRLAKEIVS